MEQEIAKQEVHLAKLHSQIANQENSSDKTEQERLCEELWTLQRYVTSLKRKVELIYMFSIVSIDFKFIIFIFYFFLCAISGEET